ncbi:MAG: hypothetical protein J6S52_02605 [Prevotella sp.]|nr:hypothetical protein [Prevotella sp.]
MEKATKKKASGENKRGRKKGCVKTGGRVAGTPNKMTTNLRSVLGEQLAPHLANIGMLIARIEDAKERVQAIVSLLPFYAPKMQNIDMNAKQEHDVRVEQSLIELDEKFSEKKAELQQRKVKLVNFD